LSAVKLGFIVAVLFAIAIVNDWSVPDRLIIILLVTLFIAWVWTRFSLQRLGLRRALSMDRVRAGEWVVEELALSNLSILPKMWVEVRDLSSLPGHEAGQVVSLGPKRSSGWSVKTRCERRGKYRLGPVVLHSGDPFGLFSQRRMIPATHELVVYPAQVDVSDVPVPMANMMGGRSTNAQTAMAAHTVSGIREYTTGDPLNRISWNATARLGRMMVKEFDPEPTSDIWIILDLNEADADMTAMPNGTLRSGRIDHDASQEYAIAVAGSLTEKCLNEGRKVGFIVNRSIPIRLDADSAHRQWFRIFETLAVASAFGQRSISEAIQTDSSRFTRNSGLMVVTSRPVGDWIDAARSLVTRQVPVTAVLIREPSGHLDGEFDRLTESLVSAHVRVASMKPGERLAASPATVFTPGA
jgi:uncharacterized protein (DUF58 family)